MEYPKEDFYPSVEDFYSTRMKTREQMLHDKKLAARYMDILNQASSLHVKGNFLEHGVTMCCANPVGGILITGINPSNNKKAPKGGYYTFEETMLNRKGAIGGIKRNNFSIRTIRCLRKQHILICFHILNLHRRRSFQRLRIKITETNSKLKFWRLH